MTGDCLRLAMQLRMGAAPEDVAYAPGVALNRATTLLAQPGSRFGTCGVDQPVDPIVAKTRDAVR